MVRNAFALVLAMALAGATVPLQGQERSAAIFWGAAQIRIVPNEVSEFSREICPGGEFVPELRLAVRKNRWLTLSAGAARHAEFAADQCVNGLVPPTPDSGTVSHTDYSQVEGYSYYSATARVSGELDASPRVVLRVFAGVERLFGKDLWAITGGAGIGVMLDPGTEFVIEIERRQFSVPFEIVVTEYRQGAPVSEIRNGHERLEVQGGVRFGFAFPIGGRPR